MIETVEAVQPKYIDFTKAKPDEVLFNNFVKYNPADPVYEEVTSREKLKTTVEAILEHYNATHQKDKLGILLFDYVLQHLSRISRIMFKPYGNGLLIGLGGNGRHSLTKLAAFINECALFRVEITKSYGRNEWQDDLKTMYKALGTDNKRLVFTFGASDVKQEFFIEDLNNILNVGEVPGLYTAEELEEIKFEMQKQVKKGQGDPMDVFALRCRKNLHLLLFMSPAGSQLRQYVRQYPSLVNCTTIDWFFSWPEEALHTVSNSFLASSSLFALKKPRVVSRQVTVQEGENPVFEQIEEELLPEELAFNKQVTELREKVAAVFVKMHKSALKLAADYQTEKNRQVYVTPTRFIELFGLFAAVMSRKHQQIDEERGKYLVGVQKLVEANEIVDRMKLQLEDLKPVLEAKSKQVEATMVFLDRETKEVEAVKAVVDQEAQVVFAQKEVAEGIKNECEARLSQAQPLLDEALKALRTLNTKDFVTMRSYQQPPYRIKLALEAVCVMLGQ